MEGDIETAERYMRRARDVRQIAEKMTDQYGRKALEEVAEGYDRMAEQFLSMERTDRAIESSLRKP